MNSGWTCNECTSNAFIVLLRFVQPANFPLVLKMIMWFETSFTHQHSAPSPQTEGAEREIKEKKKKKEKKKEKKLVVFILIVCNSKDCQCMYDTDC